MSWALFIDESGQDQRHSPYEVLAGVAVEDRNLWPLIRNLSDAQQMLFGTRLFEVYGKEAKAQKLLKTKVFKHAAQMPPIEPRERTRLALQILEDGSNPTKAQLTALAQAKIAYCEKALSLCRAYGGQAFASIVPRTAIRPTTPMLRKDYAYLFERFYYLLNSRDDRPMGYLIFDELEKSASQILIGQVSEYFIKTQKGRARSRLIVPEPLFVHSDLTTMVQIADLVAYIVSWGVRIHGMTEPPRRDLASLAQKTVNLRFSQTTDAGRTTYGFKLIRDLRPGGGEQ